MHKQKPNSIRGKIWAHDKKTPSDFFTPHSKLQSVPWRSLRQAPYQYREGACADVGRPFARSPEDAPVWWL